jgi:hypothetical protein
MLENLQIRHDSPWRGPVPGGRNSTPLGGTLVLTAPEAASALSEYLDSQTLKIEKAGQRCGS